MDSFIPHVSKTKRGKDHKVRFIIGLAILAFIGLTIYLVSVNKSQELSEEEKFSVLKELREGEDESKTDSEKAQELFGLYENDEVELTQEEKELLLQSLNQE